MPTKTTELDVRVIPPRDKHPTIFRTFENLASGESMVIINDHDPSRCLPVERRTAESVRVDI